jgi:hypothetical protein
MALPSEAPEGRAIFVEASRGNSREEKPVTVIIRLHHVHIPRTCGPELQEAREER